MANQGTVKFFNFTKGYGFITPADGSEDLFVHATDVAGNPLKEADNVTFDTRWDDRKQKTQACNVQGGSGWPMDPSKGKGKGFGGGKGFDGGKGFGGGGYGGGFDGGFQQGGGYGGGFQQGGGYGGY